ncbi:MAG: pyridoxal 5'-phosphate synthase glutaminase subunit PdxT [Candidatus Eremiobacteraeota bacterium]|nr:pyridoxal 5'-phosphate synthase glutaminase subunit PdxT [Candidatus Eremiobacteraeota bacterium]
MATEGQIRVGVLALQGDVAEHVRALRGVGADGVLVKTRAELASVKGLIIPGGESTTVMKLLERFDLCEPIRRCAAAGMPLWGTCMGMIVMARQVVGTEQPSLGLLDVSVRRNAFGRQNESDEFALEVPALGVPSFPAIFIRAPWVERAGSAVQVLARRDGHGVMVRQGNLLGTSFHPELSDDPRVHRYFTDMVRGAKR